MFKITQQRLLLLIIKIWQKNEDQSKVYIIYFWKCTTSFLCMLEHLCKYVIKVFYIPIGNFKF